MTLGEYMDKMSDYSERLSNGEDMLEEINNFQYEYMRNVLNEYNADSPEKEICYEILEYAVLQSQSGSVVQHIEDERLAKSVYDIIWDELGDYMLDFPEYYEEDGQWAIDCMFAGYYVPDWDGWFD